MALPDGTVPLQVPDGPDGRPGGGRDLSEPGGSRGPGQPPAALQVGPGPLPPFSPQQQVPLHHLTAQRALPYPPGKGVTLAP